MANNGGTNVSTANTTEYWPCAGQVSKTTTETTAQLIFRTAGTLANMQVNLSANSIAATSTINLRVNAVNSALVISPTSSQTGKLEDVTHTVNLTAGDKCNFQTVPGASTGTMTPQTMGFVYDTGSTTVQKNASMNTAGKASTTASTNTFWAISNNINASTATETSGQALIKQTGTAQNLQINISANARTTTTTYDLRKAAVSTALTIPITTATGFVEDTTHTVALVANDKINYRQNTGTGTQSITIVAMGVDISSTAGYGVIVIDTGGGSSQVAATTRYNAIMGSMSTTATETSTQYKVENVFVFSNMNVHIITNTASTLTYTLRKGAVATALTFVTTSATTGWFEDNTHTFTATAADLLDIEAITGSGGVVGWSTGVLYTQLTGGQNITKSLTETITVSDSNAILRNKTRTATETVSTGGTTVTRLNAKIRPVSQTVTISENVIKMRNKPKSLTETVTIAGTPTVQRAKIRILSESVSVPTTLSRITGKNRTATDSISVAGTPVRVKGLVRTISQTISISDALNILRNKIRTITQTISIGETPARQTSKNRAISQTVSISDALLRIKGSVKVISQTVSISDILNIARNKIRTITQTVSISETPTRKTAKTRIISQTVSIADSVARAIGARAVVKSLTESVSISDLLSILRNKSRAINQSVTTTATPTKVAGKNRSASDSIAVSDALSLIRNKIRTIIQTVTSSSSATKSTSKNRSVTQSVSVSDVTNRLTQKVRSIIQTINVTDSVSQTANTGIQHVVRIIDEARVVISDAFYIQRNLNESVSISDFVGQQKTDNTPTNFVRTLTETIITNAILSRLAGKLKSLTENTTVGTDTATITSRNKVRTNTESIHVTDSASCTKVQKNITKSLTENISSSDSASIQRGKVRRIGGPR